MKLKILGISTGNGVMIHPLKKYVMGAIETRSDYKTPGDVQWKLNFGEKKLYNSDGLVMEFNKKPNIIISHPTCGHSSSLAYSRGKKLGNAKKDATMKLFLRSVKRFKPKIFLFENLTTLFKSFPENEFDKQFPKYNLIKYHVSVSAFGNSQISRQRLIIVGIRKGKNVFKLKDFKLNQQNGRLKKCLELESNLIYPNPHLCHVREKSSTIVCMEKDFKKLSLTKIKEIWNSKEYEDRKKWDATTTGKGNMKNLPGVYRNLANSYPLTARKQNRQFNSKGDIMSPRELARIQGIPDDFKLWYDKAKDQYCINKARVTATKCPPYEIGQWFADCLMKVKLKSKSK
jgi:site-specific DNA-cytosine methylase